MSQTNRILALAAEMAAEVNKLNAKRGALDGLQTQTKASIVAAINELNTALANATNIDDNAASPSKTFSSEKITVLVQQTVSDLVNGAPEALNTLQEIASELQGQASSVDDLLTRIDRRVRVDAAQTLSAAQQAQARANIGAVAVSDIGNVDTDYVAAFRAALAGN